MEYCKKSSILHSCVDVCVREAVFRLWGPVTAPLPTIDAYLYDTKKSRKENIISSNMRMSLQKVVVLIFLKVLKDVFNFFQHRFVKS